MISSTVAGISYPGNGSTVTAYAIPFRFDDDSWLDVSKVASDGTVTALSLGAADFAVSGDGASASASLTTAVEVAATSTLRIRRATPKTQVQDLAYNDAFPSATTEGTLDKVVMQVQDQDRQREELEDRTLRAPDGEELAALPAATSRASKYAGFDSNGDPRVVSADTILSESSGAPTGTGVPAGGSTDDSLVKDSAADQDVSWGARAKPDGSNITTTGNKQDFREAIRTPGVYAQGGSLAGLRAALSANRSCGIAVCGDSTSTQTSDWLHLWLAELAAAHTDYSVNHFLWSGSAWSTLWSQAGGLGERHWSFPTTGTPNNIYLSAHDFGIPVGTDDCAVEAKVKLDDWSLISGSQDIFSIWSLPWGSSSSADRLLTLRLYSGKEVAFTWYDESAVYSELKTTSTLPYSNGDSFWVRVEFDADNGSSQKQITVKYRTLDTDSWTTLQTVTSAGVTTLRNLSNGSDDTYGIIGPQEGLNVYRLRVFDQLDPTVGPLPMPPIDHWDKGDPNNTATLEGSPVITLRNASVNNFGFDEFLDSTHGSYTAWSELFFDTDEGIIAAMVSLGHNQNNSLNYCPIGKSEQGGSDILDELQARFPLANRIYVAQNPENTITATNERHAVRMARLINRAGQDGDGLLNAYQAFMDSETAVADLLADTVHPNATGNQLWAALLSEAYATHAL